MMPMIENICKVPEVDKYSEETDNKLIVESYAENSCLVKLKIGNNEITVNANLLMRAIENCTNILAYGRPMYRRSEKDF